ncbi:MAG: tripartite tricarboxylate transporter TctB family protein [Pseudomonas sp.]|uniref:tripartite tricarboxylate transporter TctB family protein n=1 Tax=Pseudomonas sp. TaxID=306 RepID=UPI003D6E3711
MPSLTAGGWLNRYNKDYYGGGLILAVGLGVVYRAWHYPLGTLSHMGPGYFPVIVGGALALLGLAIVGTALSKPRLATAEGAEQAAAPEWRGWGCIVLANLAFIVLGRYGGLIPATFAIVFISALGDRENTVRSALILALVMVVVCVVIFAWALKLQFPLLAWG